MRFRPYTLSITAVASLLVSCSPSATKDDRGVETTADTYLTKPVFMRAGGLVSNSRKKALAISGAPLKVRAGNQSLSIDKALTIACGDMTGLLEFYQSKAKELNGAYTHAEPGYSILIPFCIPTEFATMQPNNGDTLEGILKKLSYIDPKYQPTANIVRHLAQLNDLEDRIIENDAGLLSVPLRLNDSIQIPKITFSNPYAVRNENTLQNLSSDLDTAYRYTDFLHDQNTDLDEVLRRLNPNRYQIDASGLYEELLLANNFESNEELLDYIELPNSLSVPIEGHRFFQGNAAPTRRASILVKANDTKESLVNKCQSLTTVAISCPSEVKFEDPVATEVIFWGSNMEPFVADSGHKSAFVRGLSARTSASLLGDELAGPGLSGIVVEAKTRHITPPLNKQNPPPQNIDNHFLSTPNTDDSCQTSYKEIFDVEHLIERYLVEYVKAKSTNLIPQPVTIGIIDTGVGISNGWRVKEDAFLKSNFFALNKNTLTVGSDCIEGSNCDIDNNYIKMDVYGATYNPDPETLEKFSGNVGYHRSYLANDYLKDENLKGIYAHGTQVSSRAIGGMVFVENFQNNRLNLNLPVKIRPVNITSSTKLAFAAPEGVKKVINHLDTGLSGSARPKIINISYKVSDPPQVLDDVIKGREFLIVAAAGQSTKNNGVGNDLSKDASYRHWPANMGGTKGDSDNVISVAASQDNNSAKPAKWADRGRHAVDLFAQGLNVPVWTPGMGVGAKAEGCATLANGSSFSAPQVSFASAMIMHLGGTGFEKPFQVKSRLLFSVDYYPSLRRIAKSSGVLNAIKAISLRTDVIQLSNNNSLVFGKLADRNQFINSILRHDNCTIGERSLSRVKKVTVEKIGAGYKVVFWTTLKPSPQGNGFRYEYQEVEEELSCAFKKQELENITFEFMEEDVDEQFVATRETKYVLRLHNVRDIVFSELHLTTNQ